MRLDEVLPDIAAGVLHGDPATDIVDVVIDDRTARPGALFVCLRGAHADGHDHAPRAVAQGAAALLCERVLDVPVAQVVVPDSRVAMAGAAAAVHGHPSHDLAVVGITGTNGKTTTASLVRHVLTEAGMPCGMLGTLTGTFTTPTTPEAPILQAALAAARAAGDEAIALEVSSHGLVRHRVDAVRFAVAVFTNLSQDHLEEHGTMDAYFAAKASLFTDHPIGAAVICTDDRWGRALAARLAGAPHPVRTYGSDDLDGEGGFVWHGHPVRVPLAGRFNALNALAAAHVADLLGLAPDVVAAALRRAPGVPGRFEAVAAGQPFRVLVDYSHTPDALANALAEARHLAAGHRTIVVFGCGGDRDPTTRAPMGAVAGGADIAVVTSDNPRSEAPRAIIDGILVGLSGATAEVLVEEDRRQAVTLAVGRARPGDVVLLAGKGHETYQEVGGVKHHLDDREEAVKALAVLGWTA